MNDILLDTPEGNDVDETTVEVSGEQAMRPENLPDKFWDQENGSVRVDEMTKSYQELERKLGGAESLSAPPSADDYEISIDDSVIETDSDVNARLHAAGLTQAQAQTVYELANEKLMPIVAEMSGAFEANNQTERLKNHFGGEEKWDAAKHQIAAWGRESFSDDVFEVLSSTYEGVLTMQRMMSSNEPNLGQVNSIANGADEAALKKMMSDPRYWRTRDPAFIERVRQGFRTLYPDNQ